MTFSGLASKTYDTSQKSSRQGAKIDMIICHHAATTNAAQVLNAELTGSRQVSSNYIITNTGEIWGVVPEEDRAWTSGSASDGGKGAAFDRRAITFECADESIGGSWPISAASQAAIVKLMVDVHQRYGVPLDRDHIVGHRELYTRWGASYATACPGGMNVDDLVNRARAAVGAAPIPPQSGGGGSTAPDPENGGIVGVNRSVKDVQTFLISHGFSCGPTGADNQWGPNTEAACKAYQKSVGLDPDGKWGPLTDAKAFGTTPTQHQPAIAEDGERGPATITRWQQVMATPVDGTISNPSPLIKADQHYLNSVVNSKDIKNLTGDNSLAEDGIEGVKTIKVRQFLLFNKFAKSVFGRAASISDFDGKLGPNTNKLHQHGLNLAAVGSKKY